MVLTTALAGLIVIFLLGSLRPVNMGAIALVMAFALSALSDTSTDELRSGFPVSLLITLVGVTYLFGIAKTNGTVDRLVQLAVSAVRGRKALIPWIVFLVATALASIGAASPAAVAIVAPIGIAFALQNGTSPLMNGLMAVNGAAAGSFSPVGVLGGIVLGAARQHGLEVDPVMLFGTTFGFNVLVAVGTVLIFRRHGVSPPAAEHFEDTSASGSAGLAVATRPRAETRNRTEQAITLAGISAMVVAVTGFGVDTGLAALSASVVLALLFPKTAQASTSSIAWPVVLLVCGIVTYISVLERIGVLDSLGQGVTAVGAPLLAALVLCFIGGLVSAFASTTGILGALVPMSIPFLLSGHIAPTALLAALCVSSSVVDASPFSTNGALIVANVPEEQRAATYKALLLWGFALIIMAPLTSWAFLVVLL
ncbi:UIT1 family transporter [Saccharopolyspora erythraea NRRL 2338]|uniref:Dicarboxylate-carrier protein n=2 Tax=Saccharopolyspora erythraea TaxID=1836 RepID=A4FC52_SACEN|nr:SLC13 family permease [Saccharopolyspora erythraea]EQD82342.1 DeoR family transcriptional regulator [Saccharopolyspora erythraea D]PFG95393.1 UIT1 family transporter [Saccharopolyspora erythraea NRRL 2338]QRK92033.1 SLC13 family permease [Saccharopolyspora erythraea]CAM01627.1 dicarboxylate-carrier protein [Saccharopolyspora erythraea NRRL 2338]